MTRYFLLLLYVIVNFASAEPKIVTSGNNSPVIQNSDGGIVNLGSMTIIRVAGVDKAKQAAKRVKEPAITKAVDLLEKGQLIEAKKELDYFFSQEKDAIVKIAAGRYIKGQIEFINERYDLADISFGVALDLNPDDCSYLLSKSLSLLSLGRFREAGSLTASRDLFTSRCITSGREVDRTQLYLVQARLAIEDRNRADSLRLLDLAYTQIKNGKTKRFNQSWIDPTCNFADLILILPKLDQSKWSNAAAYCMEAIASTDKTKSTFSSALVHFYSQFNEDSNGLPLGYQLKNNWGDPGEIFIPGADLIKKRFVQGRFISELGFRTLWKAGDKVETAKLYSEAFDTLEPLISSGRPTVIMELMQLVVRISDYKNRISVSEPLPDAQRLRDAIRSSSNSLQNGGGISECMTLDRIADAGRSLLSREEQNSLFSKAYECFEYSTPPKSFLGLKNKLTMMQLMYSQTRSTDSLKKITEVRKALFGFPNDNSLHIEQAEDYLAIAQLFLNTGDVEYLSEAKSFVDQSISEAMQDSTSVLGRSVIAAGISMSALPRTTLNTTAFDILEAIAKEKIEVSPINKCVGQNAKSFQAESILVYGVEQNNLTMVEKAASVWRSELAGENHCLKSANSTLTKIVFLRQADRTISSMFVTGTASAEELKLCKILPVCEVLMNSGTDPKVLRIIAELNLAEDKP